MHIENSQILDMYGLICSGMAENDEVEYFIDLGNILGKIWVSLSQVEPNNMNKAGLLYLIKPTLLKRMGSGDSSPHAEPQMPYILHFH